MNSSAGVSRRDLFRATGARAAALSALSYSSVLGANDRIRLGVVGCGGRGVHVMETFQKNATIEVTAVCDVYGARIDRALQSAPRATGFYDHRKLLDLKEVDAVLVATPDHWHAPICIDALNSGRDVYVEKPLTLRREEGPEIVRAARVNQRICQVGMQQRSGSLYLQARAEYIQTGKLGKIGMVRTIWHGGPPRPRELPTTEKPSNLDWARFLGPVRWREWNPYQYFDYRRFLDFGGGKITDFFTHWVDVVHMFLGQDNPVSAVAAGGIYLAQDGRDAPDTITVLLEYPGGFTVSFESGAGAAMPEYGIQFCGTQGSLFINRGRFEYRSGEKGEPPVIVKNQVEQTIEHVNNFIECCRTRQLPNGDVYIGHRSAQASHLGVTAYVEKRRIRFDPDREIVLPS